jgi:hypothetical protein
LLLQATNPPAMLGCTASSQDACFAAACRADNGWRYWWTGLEGFNGGAWSTITYTTNTRWRLPAGVSCPGGCVLQWWAACSACCCAGLLAPPWQLPHGGQAA